MKCANCGTAIPDDAAFCPKCGSKSVASAAATASDTFRPKAVDDDAEQRLWAGGYSGKAMIGSWMLGILVSAALVAGWVFLPEFAIVFAALVGAIWLVLIFTFAYRRLSYHYELTTQRFNHKAGILTRRSDRIEAIDIDDVTFEQGVVERMFGTGKIRISSSDRTHPEIVLVGIDNVKQVADLIDDARRKERRKRGVHIESI